MYHECYLKEAFEDPLCMVDPCVPWSSEDPQWHGESGQGIACGTPVVANQIRKKGRKEEKRKKNMRNRHQERE